MATEEMRGLPFDSKQQTAEDGSVYEDREIFSADIAEYFGYVSSNGICLHEDESFGDQLKIEAGTSGIVVFNPGTIKIQGRMGWMEDAVEKQSDPGGSKPRYDTAVIELNLSTSERRFIPKIVKGEESDSPTPPELTQTSNVYQLGLADIYRTANSTALGTITDTRKDKTRCGISGISVPDQRLDHYANLDPSTLIPSGADLNDYTEPGSYLSPSGTISGSLSNCPVTKTGFNLQVMQTTTGGVKQFIIDTSTNANIFARRINLQNSTFYDWLQMGTTVIEKVWENASLTSVFAAQTIKINTTGAQFAIVPYLYARNYSTGGVGIVDWHNSSISFAENYNMFRHAMLTNSGVEFSAGKIALTYASQKDDNERIVPTAIYLVKGVI